jgi:hypothetical protein
MGLASSFAGRFAALVIVAAMIAAALVAVDTLASPTGALRQALRPAGVQTAQAVPAQKPQKRGETQKPASAENQQIPIRLEQALYLIRSTLLTLNDANRSGNYTVLRDLAAPGFQTKNTAADLARIFADLRTRHVDLFAVALLAPQMTAPPRIENGMLRLTGIFPTQPSQITFDLLFQSVANQWRLFGISAQVPNAPVAEQEQPQPQPGTH